VGINTVYQRRATLERSTTRVVDKHDRLLPTPGATIPLEKGRRRQPTSVRGDSVVGLSPPV